MVHNHNIPEILYINIEKTEAPWGDMKKPSDSFRKSEGFMVIFSSVLGLHCGDFREVKIITLCSSVCPYFVGFPITFIAI